MQSFARAKIHEGKLIREQEKIIAGQYLPAHKTGLAVKQALLIMKLTAIFLFLLCMQVSARTMAQVTLSEKNAPLEKVLQSVKRQSGYAILYDQVLVQQKGKPVSINITNATVEQALAMVFKNQALTYEITPGNIILVKEKKIDAINIPPVPLIPPLIDIKGKVTDETGKPVAGAAVRIKGTTRGTTTNDSGEFVLEGVDETAVLVIGGVNIESKEIKVDGKSEISVVAKLKVAELSNLEVQVSTGYQTLPKERSTGSFTVIDNKLFTREVSTGALSRLDGITNGLLFDKRSSGAPSLIIRGYSTIFGNSQPLVVVDNFPYDGDINNINPNDVETVTLLKDAAAASIWGVRAANGVIVITTKKGKFSQPLQVNLTINATLNGKPNFNNLHTMQPGDFIDVEQYLFSQEFYKRLENASTHPPLTPAVEIMIQQRDGLLTEAEATAQLNALRTHDVRDDFTDYLYQTGANMQYAAGINGGSAGASYAMNAGWDDNTSNRDARYKRFTLHGSLNVNLTKWLQWQSDIRYSNSSSIEGKPAYSDITGGGRYNLYPYARLADAGGNALPLTKDYREVFKQQAEMQGLLNWDYYPLTDYKYKHNNSRLQDVVINEALRVNILKNLSAEARVQYENAPGEISALADMGAYSTRDYINRFTQVNSDGSLSYPVPMGSILQTSAAALKNYAVRGQVNYSAVIGKGRLDALAGAEIRQAKTSASTGLTYGFNENNLTYTPVNYTEYYPSYINGSSSKITEGKSFSSVINRYNSVYANAAYNVAEKYVFSASLRRDGSNLFGAATNQKFVPLWSTGLGWLASRENFWHSKFLPYLKLRLTYGYNGNVNNSISGLTTIRYYAYNMFIPEPYAAIQTLPNPELRWEKTGVLNAGIDFRTAGDVLSGSIEFYKKHATDLIAFAPIDPTVGVLEGRLQRNVADMTDGGLEVQLTSRNFNGKFKWNTTLIFDYNVNKVTNYDTSSSYASSYITSGISIVPVNGKPLYNVFSYRWGGLDSAGNPQGYLHGKLSGDYSTIMNETTVGELVYSGPALPPVYGSLRNDFSYSNFSLSFNITYRFAYYFRKSSIGYYQLFNYWAGHSDYALRWQKPGDENHTDVPSMVYPASQQRDNMYTLSTATVLKGDNIRLQDIRLGYSFGNRKGRSQPFHNLQVYLYAQNLGILWRANKDNLDPDYPGGLAPAMNISGGLSINF